MKINEVKKNNKISLSILFNFYWNSHSLIEFVYSIVCDRSKITMPILKSIIRKKVSAFKRVLIKQKGKSHNKV